jgi:hypothetical protein
MSPEQRKDALAEYERILTAGTTAAPKRRLRLR